MLNEMQEEEALVHCLSRGLKQGWSLPTKLRYSQLMTIGVEMGLIEEMTDVLMELLKTCKTEEKANIRMDEIEKQFGVTA